MKGGLTMREQNKITTQANNLINGNITEFKKAVGFFSKLDFLNLIQEYSLLSGMSISDVVVKFKSYFD
jgi:flagellar basal body rod protein FlgG